MIPVGDAHQAIETVKLKTPDLMILDSTLFNSNCSEIIIKIREISNAPLLILSDGETEIDRAKGLESGADEYIDKPFNLIELLATCRALFRRSNNYRSSAIHSISTGNIVVDLDTQEVYISGKPVKLTPIEFRLLTELIRNEGRILTHRKILEKVWGYEYTADNGFVKKYIYRLRTKLMSDNNHKEMITSIRGTGYKLCRPDFNIISL